MLARTRGSDALGEFPFLGGEVTTGDVVSFGHSAAFNAYGINFAAALLAELNDLKRLFDMQIAQLAFAVTAIVIVDAIGDVRVLLDFAQDQARADRVRGSGGNKNRIASTHRNVFEAILGGAVHNGMLEFFGGDAGLEANHHLRTFARAHRVPHFGLSAAASGGFVARRVVIAGMNLHGKLLLGKNEFHEQRERIVMVGLSSGPLRRQLGPDFAQLFACERAGSEATFVAGHPGFAQRLGQIRFRREKRRKRKRTPRTWTKYWLKARGIQIHVSQSHLGWPKKRAKRRNPSSIRSMEVA